MAGCRQFGVGTSQRPFFSRGRKIVNDGVPVGWSRKGPEPESPSFLADGLLPPAVHQMGSRHERVLVDHAWPGIAHDCPDAFPHFGAVAVYRAPGTGGLAFLKRALFEAFQSVCQESVAAGAELAPPVLPPAIQGYHRRNGFRLSAHTAPPGRPDRREAPGLPGGSSAVRFMTCLSQWCGAPAIEPLAGI